jgi:YVTN family beta-propeller protein
MIPQNIFTKPSANTVRPLGVGIHPVRAFSTALTRKQTAQMAPRTRTHVFRQLLLLTLLLVAGATATSAAQQCLLYVTDYRAANVRVMDCTGNSNTALNPIQVGQQPFGIVASPDGHWLYVANYGSNSVSVINTDANVVYYSAGVGAGPIGVALSPDGARLYVSHGNALSVLETGWNDFAAPDIAFETQTSWLLNIAVVNKCP